MEGDTISKIDLGYAERKVRFSLRACFHRKRFCVLDVEKQALPLMLSRLKHLEDEYTWKMLASAPREVGLTKEFVGTDSYNRIEEKRSECEGVGMGAEDYFFHLRVKNQDKHYGLFRLFGYQKGDLFCVTHFDLKGELQH